MPQLSNGPEKATMEEALVFALDRLGYEKLREEQEKVLRAFVGGRDGTSDRLWEIFGLRVVAPRI